MHVRPCNECSFLWSWISLQMHGILRVWHSQQLGGIDANPFWRCHCCVIFQLLITIIKVLLAWNINIKSILISNHQGFIPMYRPIHLKSSTIILLLTHCWHARRLFLRWTKWGRNATKSLPCLSFMFRWQNTWDWKSLNKLRAKQAHRYVQNNLSF